MHGLHAAAKESTRCAVAAARSDAYARGVRETRDALTRMIPRDDENTLYPSGKLAQPMLRVAARFDLQPRELLDPGEFYARAEMMRFRQGEVFALIARQHALVLPDGTKVVWWGWELGR